MVFNLYSERERDRDRDRDRGEIKRLSENKNHCLNDPRASKRQSLNVQIKKKKKKKFTLQ